MKTYIATVKPRTTAAQQICWFADKCGCEEHNFRVGPPCTGVTYLVVPKRLISLVTIQVQVNWPGLSDKTRSTLILIQLLQIDG